MSARAFRFGVGGPRTLSSTELAETARKAEGLGYSTIVFPDHFADQLAPVPAIMAAAAATTTLRVGSMVFNGDFRHPVMLAKEAATLDLLSDGRLEIGLGAGWMESEYNAAGLTLDPPATRVERLGETIEITRRLFRDGVCDFEGRHFTVRELEGFPKPVQRPHPPILIGGGGRTILSLAAREANIVGLAPRFTPPERYGPRSILADAVARRLDIVRSAAGARFSELEINTYPVFGPVSVTTRAREQLAQRVQRLRRRYPNSPVTDDELLESPHVFVGSVDSLVEKIRALRERFGISYVRIGFDEIEAFAPVVDELAGG